MKLLRAYSFSLSTGAVVQMIPSFFLPMSIAVSFGDNYLRFRHGAGSFFGRGTELSKLLSGRRGGEPGFQQKIGAMGGFLQGLPPFSFVVRILAPRFLAAKW
ncbi:MAG TPA: hypothetical protein VI794_00890 [Patescibacteria group bacterium]|nr:hypothetical protein [Patescibacteria group bacterium]